MRGERPYSRVGQVTILFGQALDGGNYRLALFFFLSLSFFFSRSLSFVTVRHSRRSGRSLQGSLHTMQYECVVRQKRGRQRSRARGKERKAERKKKRRKKKQRCSFVGLAPHPVKQASEVSPKKERGEEGKEWAMFMMPNLVFFVVLTTRPTDTSNVHVGTERITDNPGHSQPMHLNVPRA